MARKLIFPRKKTEPLDNEQREILPLTSFQTSEALVHHLVIG